MRDMIFVHDFIVEWLNPEMEFAGSCAPWMERLPKADQIGGACAEDVPIRAVYMMKRLVLLEGSWETHPGFAKSRVMDLECSEEERAVSKRQGAKFFSVLIVKGEKHFEVS